MFNLNPNHKSVRQYYIELEEFDRLGIKHEMAVKTAFQHILEYCCKQVNWKLIRVQLLLSESFRLPFSILCRVAQERLGDCPGRDGFFPPSDGISRSLPNLR